MNEAKRRRLTGSGKKMPNEKKNPEEDQEKYDNDAAPKESESFNNKMKETTSFFHTVRRN